VNLRNSKNGIAILKMSSDFMLKLQSASKRVNFKF